MIVIAYLYSANFICVSRHSAQKRFIMFITDWSRNYTYKLSKCFAEQVSFKSGLERVYRWSLLHAEGRGFQKVGAALERSSLSKCFKPPSGWIEEILKFRTEDQYLKSPASPLFTQSFIQAQIIENIKALRHWPLCGEFTGDRWIPRTKGQ